jgi:hypothetical protein
VSWWPVIALCAGAYGLKALGLMVGGRLDPGRAERWHLEMLVVPILAALIAVQSFSTGHRLVRASAAGRGLPRLAPGAVRRRRTGGGGNRSGAAAGHLTGAWPSDGGSPARFGNYPHERARHARVACRR